MHYMLYFIINDIQNFCNDDKSIFISVLSYLDFILNDCSVIYQYSLKQFTVQYLMFSSFPSHVFFFFFLNI